MTAGKRTRQITWDDPAIGAAAATALSGLDYLRGLLHGEIPLPPISHLVDYDFDTVDPGRVAFRFQPREFHYNPIGSVHGGILATLLDSAIGCSVHSTLPQGTGYTVLSMTVQFLRQVGRDAPALRCEGRVLHAGRRVATAEARLGHDDRLYACATGTCLITAG